MAWQASPVVAGALVLLTQLARRAERWRGELANPALLKQLLQRSAALGGTSSLA